MKSSTKIAIIVLVVAGVLALAFGLRSVAHRMRKSESLILHPAPPRASWINESAIAIAHPVHPGGVKDVAALRALIQRDGKIAQHYKDAGFDVNCATDEILAANMWATTSYRIRDHFAYTKGPVLLLAGEHLIVDNCHGVILRGKCANVILAAAKYPQIDTEQPIGSLILPPGDLVPPNVTAPPVPPIIVPPGIPLVPPLGIPPVYPPYVCCGVPIAPYSPPIETPEPSLGIMLLGGWAFVLGMFWIFRKQRS